MDFCAVGEASDRSELIILPKSAPRKMGCLPASGAW